MRKIQNKQNHKTNKTKPQTSKDENKTGEKRALRNKYYSSWLTQVPLEAKNGQIKEIHGDASSRVI